MMINKHPEVRKERIGPARSSAQHQRRLEHLAGAQAFVTDSRVIAWEEARPLGIVTIVKIEAANILALFVGAEEPAVPGAIDLRSHKPHLFEVGDDLQADLDTFVTDEAGMPFEDACHFALAVAAEGAANDLCPPR